MATQATTAYADNSTFANFSSWAKLLSDFLLSCGWVLADDVGQMVWTPTVLTISDVTVSGGNAVYTYSSYTGPVPRKGMSVKFSGFAASSGVNNATTTITISQVAVSGIVATYTYSSYTGPVPQVGMVVTLTGFGIAANNIAGLVITGGSLGASGNFTVAAPVGATNETHAATATTGPILTAVSGGASGTVTITAAAGQTNETIAASGTTTAMTAAPVFGSSGNFYYEVWKGAGSQQSTCPIFMKLEYGAGSSASINPGFAITIGTASNNLGTLLNAGSRHVIVGTGSDGATPREVWLSGDGTEGRFGFVLFRDGVMNLRMDFVIQRSLDNTGAVTDDYFTYVCCFTNTTTQRSWAKGQAPTVALTCDTTITFLGFGVNPSAYGNFAAFSPLYPVLGRVCNPMTMVGTVRAVDVTESTNISATLYGTTRTYKVTKIVGTSDRFGNSGNSTNGCFCLGWF